MPKTKAKISVDTNGNAFAILGAARKAMRRAGVDEKVIEKYTKKARSGDYDCLLRTTMEYVEFE